VTYTQKDIDALLSCAKSVSDPPKRNLRLVGAHWRNDMKLVAVMVDGEFSVFFRRSEDFPENFSIGLTYDPKDGSGEITLVRCNGQHGVFGGTFDPNHPHWSYHIHRATEATIAAGLRPEHHAENTAAYASFEEAVQHFVKLINLNSAEADKYFPNKAQTALPFEEGVN
jgi:hypothetical protein